ncbi:hypothetical protein A6E05_04650 [Aliivibrio sp. 1S165]|uniref:DUF5666 domain-containing protein n=1 Tax=unclassified Aliivibrio TaxID=2645654 RepID=UPI00080DC369|nr:MULTISPECIES: DUF5666 domain-containing protein [unclassified Aliivibrio]OCH13602.1 hypothetical protein A6E05_04650 [Aliivibrio sp. 1S165]OCH31755.1 hypothetical protein A6E06_03785 [Aliivibrio sp. 1S175]
MKKVAILLLGTAVLTGCGSEDSGDSNDHHASSSYIGAIEAVDTNTDTMTINSMPLSLASTRIELNGHYVDSTELDVGMQVDVEYDDGIAYEVDIDPEIVGIATLVTESEITVNGQVFEHTNIAKDLVGTNTNRVMLFGYVDQAGKWIINAIHKANFLPVEDLYEGKITSIDKSNSFFNIGTMKIDYSNTHLDQEDISELQVNAWVEVEGTYETGTNEFKANDVDVEDDLDLANAEVEGYVTTLVLNNGVGMMTLNGKTVVTITENTRFEDGTKDQLKVGSKVDVDLINNAGQLQASEIEFD